MSRSSDLLVNPIILGVLGISSELASSSYYHYVTSLVYFDCHGFSFVFPTILVLSSYHFPEGHSVQRLDRLGSSSPNSTLTKDISCVLIHILLLDYKINLFFR